MDGISEWTVMEEPMDPYKVLSSLDEWMDHRRTAYGWMTGQPDGCNKMDGFSSQDDRLIGLP